MYQGEYGGCVKRTFQGDGMKWIAGAILKPENVMSWPLGNRIALSKEGKVDWFGPPVAAEQEAREEGSTKVKEAKVGATKEKAPAQRRQRVSN